jgi:integrase
MRGSVLKRGKTWSYVLYLGRANDGRKRQKWVGGFRTRKDAEGALSEALERVRTGSWADPGRQTVGEFLEDWLTAVTPSLRPSTAASYEQTLRGWVIPRIGGLKLSALTSARLSALYGELLKSGRRDGRGGLSARSVAYAHRILVHALKDAVAWGLLARNPAAHVDAPRAATSEMHVWSQSEVQRFLAFVADDRLYALWAVLLATGLRRGEALGLRWDDVDFERRRLAIQRAAVVVGYDVQVAEPKTARGRRSVSIDPTTAAVLGAFRKRQLEERLAWGPAWQDSGYVFTSEDGRLLHPQQVTVTFKRLAREAGLPLIRLHDLRHTAATLALTAGIHPKVVSERLGHASIGITLDTYSHVGEGLQEEAASKVAGLIFGDEAAADRRPAAARIRPRRARPDARTEP